MKTTIKKNEANMSESGTDLAAAIPPEPQILAPHFIPTFPPAPTHLLKVHIKFKYLCFKPYILPTQFFRRYADTGSATAKFRGHIALFFVAPS